MFAEIKFSNGQFAEVDVPQGTQLGDRIRQPGSHAIGIVVDLFEDEEEDDSYDQYLAEQYIARCERDARTPDDY